MKRGSPRAFSLVELLVAMSVSIILLVLILRILSTSLDTWRTSGSYRQQHHTARILFETIESDLQAAMLRPNLPSGDIDSVPWITVESVPFMSGNSSRISLLSPIPDQTPGWEGDVCLVQYSLVERNNRDGKNVIIFRTLTDPTETHAIAKWDEASLSNPATADPSFMLASNLGRFQVSLEVRDENAETKIIKAEKNPLVSHDGDVSWDGSMGAHRLFAVHVSMEVLGQTGINIVFDRGYDAVPEMEKRSFFLRVPLGDGR